MSPSVERFGSLGGMSIWVGRLDDASGMLKQVVRRYKTERD